jgi:hypothetical protein
LANYEFDPDAQDDFSPDERAERDQFRARISQYFCQRIENDPAVLEVGSIASLWRKVQDGLRTEMLCESSYKPHLFRPELSSIGFLAKITGAGYYHPGGTHSVVFAVYCDGTLLWLDDHTNNQEFDTFWRRENILWQNAPEAAAFMMETKFHYVPEPGRYFILNSVADIPQGFRDYLVQKEAHKELEDYDKSLADVAPLIYAPSLIADDSGIHLRFCVYIDAGGRVWSLNCHFDLNGCLTHTGEILGDWVGDAFAPR